MHFEALLPHIDGVIQFMLHTITTDQDGAVILGKHPQIALSLGNFRAWSSLSSRLTANRGCVFLDALEFWQYIAEAGTSPEARTAALDAIRPYLPQLVEAVKRPAIRYESLNSVLLYRSLATNLVDCGSC